MNKKPIFTMQDIVPYYYDMNCYEYLLACLHHIKEDYPMFQFKGTDHMRSEFFADVDAMAYYFKEELGMQVGDAFSVFTPNTIEEVVVLFALNKIGCIANLIHPLFPSDAMRTSVEYTKSKGVLLLDMVAPMHADTLKEMNVKVILTSPKVYAAPVAMKAFIQPDEAAVKAAEGKFEFEFYGDILKRNAGKTVEGLYRSGDLTAVYMNGGGTTGVSRTIMLSSTVLNAVTNNALAPIIPSDDPAGLNCKILALPFFHAYGLCGGLFCCIYAGCKAIPMIRFDADEFIDIMKKNHIYEIIGVPNMYRKLLDHPEFSGDHLKYVKYAFAGGDYVPIDFLTRFNNMMSSHGSTATLMPGYGLTECGAVDCINMPWATKPGTVGMPLKTNTVKILDDEQNEVPRGTVGEIAFSGNCLMKGYLMPDGRLGEGLYTDKEGTKWVLTGDLGKMDEDNFITFVARKKRLIIISGYNVFPADIEDLLETQPFLKECCAVQGYDAEKKPIVRLYIVLSEDADPARIDEYKEILIKECANNLNGFSVPRDIQVIDALPRTRMEKIDFLKLTEIL